MSSEDLVAGDDDGVIYEDDLKKLSLDPVRVRIDTFARGIPGVNSHYRMRLTYEGLVVEGEGPQQLVLRKKLLLELDAKVKAACPPKTS